MSLSKNIEKLKYDTRMIDINLKDGSLNQKEYEAYLSSLEDTSGNRTNVDFKHELGSPASEGAANQSQQNGMAPDQH